MTLNCWCTPPCTTRSSFFQVPNEALSLDVLSVVLATFRVTSGLFKTFRRLYSTVQCFHAYWWLLRLIGRQNHRLQRVKPLTIERDFHWFRSIWKYDCAKSHCSDFFLVLVVNINIWRSMSIESLIVIVSIERNLNFNNATIIPPLACKVCHFLSWTKIILDITQKWTRFFIAKK